MPRPTDPSKRQPIPTARFWTFVNDSWVKLSLKPGQALSRCTGGPDEEGFSYTAETWEHEGGRVRCETVTWGRDCDGGHEDGNVCVCPLPDLARNDMTEMAEDYPTWRGIMAPAWKADRDGSYHRDHSAEAAGY